MKLYYSSYLNFVLKADVLTRELSLSAEEAAELLARVSGYETLSRMPLGQSMEFTPPYEQLVDRLLSLRPDICPNRAKEIIRRMQLPASD